MGDVAPNNPPHRKAPQFMLELFNAVADSHGRTKEPGLLQGNVVRSFEDKGHPERTYHSFNLSSFGKEEMMIKAELRIFRHKQALSEKSFGHHFYKVDIYVLLDSGLKPWSGNLIASRLLPLYTQGWEVFNVTQTVSKWIQDSDSNHGFLVVTALPSGNSLDSSMVQVDRGQKQRDGKHAFLVIFSDDARRGSKPNLSHFPAPVLAQGGSVPPSDKEHRRRKVRSAPYYIEGRRTSCKRFPLYVDFEEIGWSGWIISPRGYNAYHCKGACPFPLGEGLRATNHATVQSIVYALKLSKEVETPCCVPDKLHSINLLYFDDEENVVLKQYDDMVAVSCGCH
ncbi:BMP2B protein, partial [Amia calva]|nr:BMP2B protein [Amia calva]